MIKKIINIFYLFSPLVFFTLVISFYFSEKNINFVSKSRSQINTQLTLNTIKLPVLKNDTSNIIKYSNDNKKKKKYNKFFDLIGN